MVDKKALEKRKVLKSKKPKFSRQDSHKKPKLGTKWRRPKGLQSKMRLNRRGYKRSISKGWKSPKAVRGLDKTGLQPIMVQTLNQLKNIDKESQSIILSSGVGRKKKIDIINEALKLNLEIINFDAKAYLEKVEQEMAVKKASKEEKEKKKEENKTKQTKEKKKDTIEEALTEEEKQQQEKKERDKELIKRTP